MEKIYIFLIAGIFLIGSIFAFTTISLKEDWIKLDSISSKEVCDSTTDLLIKISCSLLKLEPLDISKSDLIFEKNSDGVIKIYGGK